MSSTISAGSQANPTAGTAVATTGSLSAGKYVVTVTVMMSGTLTATDLNNVQLQVGSTVIGTLLTPVGASGVAAIGTVTSPPVTVDVPASTAITVNAIGNASGASAVYKAQIVATIA